MRRFMVYLERSLNAAMQWVVFEPKGEALWATVRTTVEGFLLNEWKSGALFGTVPAEAYFWPQRRTSGLSQSKRYYPDDV
jgi:phage tail sheath protein FI